MKKAMYKYRNTEFHHSPHCLQSCIKIIIFFRKRRIRFFFHNFRNNILLYNSNIITSILYIFNTIPKIIYFSLTSL